MKPILGRRFARGIPISKVGRRTSDPHTHIAQIYQKILSLIIITDILTFAVASGRDWSSPTGPACWYCLSPSVKSCLFLWFRHIVQHSDLWTFSYRVLRTLFLWVAPRIVRRGFSGSIGFALRFLSWTISNALNDGSGCSRFIHRVRANHSILSKEQEADLMFICVTDKVSLEFML